MKNLILLILSASLLGLSSCQSAINKAVQETKYSAWEMVGVEKRDLFKREVADVKESQEESGKTFKSALDKLKDIYAFDGGNIEREYRSLERSYEKAYNKSVEVKKDVSQVETVAQDLFKEWNKEIEDMKSSSLKAKSYDSLAETQAKYQTFHAALKKSEAKMEPVLAQLKDQVTYLKHNLNAQAISGLKKESVRIQGDIEALIKEMNASISQADAFIQSM